MRAATPSYPAALGFDGRPTNAFDVTLPKLVLMNALHLDSLVIGRYRLALAAPDKLRALYTEFFTALPQALEQFDVLIRAGAWLAVMSLAHAWKGNSGVLGLRSLESAFAAVNDAAAVSDSAAVRAAVWRARETAPAAEAAVGQLLDAGWPDSEER